MVAQEISAQSKPPQSLKFGYNIDRIFGKVTGMIVDKDDNLMLADKSVLPMYSMDAKFVKECELRGTAWDVSYYKKVLSS